MGKNRGKLTYFPNVGPICSLSEMAKDFFFLWGGGEQISAHLAKILFRLGQIKGSVTVELAHPFIPFVQILGGVLLVVVIMVSFLLEDKSNQYSSVDGDQPVSWKQVLAVIFI